MIMSKVFGYRYVSNLVREEEYYNRTRTTDVGILPIKDRNDIEDTYELNCKINDALTEWEPYKIISVTQTSNIVKQHGSDDDGNVAHVYVWITVFWEYDEDKYISKCEEEDSQKLTLEDKKKVLESEYGDEFESKIKDTIASGDVKTKAGAIMKLYAELSG